MKLMSFQEQVFPIIFQNLLKTQLSMLSGCSVQEKMQWIRPYHLCLLTSLVFQLTPLLLSVVYNLYSLRFLM